MANFVLPPSMADEIIAHARAGHPEEVCGIISSRNGHAVSLHRGRNVSPTPRVAFELDIDTLALQLDFEAAGLTLGAIYHSHPAGPPGPSPTDIAQATYPQSVTIICSLANPARPSLRAFRIIQGSVHEIALVASEIEILDQ